MVTLFFFSTSVATGGRGSKPTLGIIAGAVQTRPVSYCATRLNVPKGPAT